MRMVVVLPAPFGPRKPRISPFSTRKETPSTAVARPYLLVRLSTSIIVLVSPCYRWTRRPGGAAPRAGRSIRACARQPRRTPAPRPSPAAVAKYHSDSFFRVSNRRCAVTNSRRLTSPRRPAATRRRGARGPRPAGAHPSPDRDLPRRSRGSTDATLLLWDRRLESFEGLAPRRGRPAAHVRPRPRAPGGQDAAGCSPTGSLLETSRASGRRDAGAAARAERPRGHAGPRPTRARRRRPFADAEARLVSLVAARAALAVENHAYQKELIASERAGRAGHDGRDAGPRLPRAHDRHPRLRGDAARGRRAAREETAARARSSSRRSTGSSA